MRREPYTADRVRKIHGSLSDESPPEGHLTWAWRSIRAR